MAVSSYDISQAIILGTEIGTYLTEATIDEMARNGQDKANQYRIDSMIVNGMLMVLDFYSLHGADSGLTENDVTNAINTIHEYQYALMLNLDDFTAQVGSDADAYGSGTTFVYLKSGTVGLEAFSYVWEVATDGDDTFAMPFNASTIDTDSVIVTLNDADPILGDSYTLTGTTFLWTGVYPLSAGWKFEIKWWGTAI